MQFHKLCFPLMIGLVAAVGSAQAALLTNVSGDVFVNRGQGFVAIAAPTTLEEGDRVRTSAGGSAQVVYNENCAVSLSAGQAFVVRNPSAICNQPASNNAANNPFAGGNAPVLIIGGLAVAGGIGLAVALGGDDDDKPASP